MPKTKHKSGVPARIEGHTLVPNWWFDQILGKGSCARTKIVATIIRFTLGTGCREAALSNGFLGRCTGEGPNDVERGIEEALKTGMVARRCLDDAWVYRLLEIEPVVLADVIYRSEREHWAKISK